MEGKGYPWTFGLQGWQASTFGLWRATWLGTFMQIPGQRHTWQEPVFFFPRGQAFISWPVWWGMLKKSWCCGELRPSQWRSASVGQISRLSDPGNIHPGQISVKHWWFFWGHGGVPYFDPLAAKKMAWTDWTILSSGPSQSRKTWLAPWQHWGMWLRRWTLLCQKQWQIWRVHLYLIVDQLTPISSCRPWDLPTEMRRKLRSSLIFTSCKHGKAKVWVMTDIHSLIVIYGTSLLR